MIGSSNVIVSNLSATSPSLKKPSKPGGGSVNIAQKLSFFGATGSVRMPCANPKYVLNWTWLNFSPVRICKVHCSRGPRGKARSKYKDRTAQSTTSAGDKFKPRWGASLTTTACS